MALVRYRCTGAIPREIPRPVRAAIRELAAEAARAAAARADARRRERLTLHALDLLEAGHSVNVVLNELFEGAEGA